MKDGIKIGNKKNSFFTVRHKDISEIEGKIDKGLLQNNDKIKIESKGFDAIKFSPEHKQKDSIYFLREKPGEELTGQKEKEKTSERPTKVNKHTLFGNRNYKNDTSRRKRSNQKQVKSKKISLFAGEKSRSKKAKTEAMETERKAKQAEIEKQKQEKEKQKQRKLELVKAKTEARDKARKAKIEKQRQEREARKLKQLELKKAKTEAMETERKAKQAEIEKQKQEKEEQKQRKLELVKAKTEARDKARKAKMDKKKPEITSKSKEAGKEKIKPRKTMEAASQTGAVKHNDKQILNFSKIPRIRISSETERKAKQAEIDKRKQEKETRKLKQLELKKAKTEAMETERKAKQAEIEKQKQEKEEQKQRKLELVKAKTEANDEVRKIEEEETDKIWTDAKKHAIFVTETNLSKEKPSVKPGSLNKEKSPLKSKSLFSGLKANDARQSNRQVKKAFTERERVLKKRFDSGKVIQPVSPDKDKEKPDLLPISEVKSEEIKEGGGLKLGAVDILKSNALDKLGLSKKDSWEEIEFYPLIDSFAYAGIIHETETLDKLYILIEIELSEEESKNLKFIREVLGGFTLNADEFESKGKDKYLREKVEQIVEDYSLKIDAISKRRIIYFLEKKLLGLDKLEPLMKDPNIEDISCDGSDVPIFLYHRKYGSLKSNIKFESEDELSAFVVKLSQKCGKHISIANPMLDATMPDGSRIQMTLSTEVTTKGSTFTIRKFKESPFSPADLIEFNTMSSEIVAFLWMAVENGINALIAGGTASGKTSTLNALALFIPPESKIVSIEETREINLPHGNWIPGVARVGFGEVVGDKIVGEIDMYELMKAALRQRPEYILVGEIRGREAYVLFQAMATGHTTYSTVHADSAKSLVHRLEGKPIEIPRIMLQALDIVCIQTISRVKDKRARRCKQIIEIIDIDPATKEILTNEVFRWDPIEDTFHYSGKSYILERIRIEKNLSREEMTNELKQRAALLEWMRKKNIAEFKEVAAMAANYIENPLEIMKKVKEDN